MSNNEIPTIATTIATYNDGYQRYEPEVHVTFPNEHPDEDERTLMLKFTREGVIVDGYVADADVHVGTASLTYDELWDKSVA